MSIPQDLPTRRDLPQEREVADGIFCRIDWGGSRHAVCVVDAAGAVAARFEVSHDEDGLDDLVKRLEKVAPLDVLPIAIERPTGLLIDKLVESGARLVPIHPNIIKACRSRYRAAGGKSDVGDAFMIADVLRTDGHRFRPLVPQSDALKALRSQVRTRDALVADRIRQANRLRALLESYWPGAAAIFEGVDSRIALAFIKAFPTPSSAKRLGLKRLEAFLAKEKYSGRTRASVLLERLRAAASGHCGPAEEASNGLLAGSLARILESVVAELAALTARIEHDVEQLADGRVMMSFPRAGRVNAAQILVEIGDVRERFQTEAQLAAEAGTCPVTHASGKSRGVAFRWACNHRLRRALCFWAGNSRHSSPWAQDIYARARARGCDHPHAVRILARAWVRVIWRTWQSATPYDPAKHTAAKPFLTAA